MTQNMTTDPLGFPIFALAVAASSMRSRRKHESREDLRALDSGGPCSRLLRPWPETGRALDSGGLIWPKGLSSVNCLDE